MLSLFLFLYVLFLQLSLCLKTLIRRPDLYSISGLGATLVSSTGLQHAQKHEICCVSFCMYARMCVVHN